MYYGGLVFLTGGDKDVGEDDDGRQEETGCLSDPPPQVSERSQSY